jgi:hypothetical protein
MKTRLLIIVALVFGAAVQTPTLAGEVRFPESGYPEFTFQIPDDWTAKLDDSGNMIVTSPDHSAALSLSLVDFSGTLDETANGAAKAAGATPPRRGESTTVSGYGGNFYYSSMSTQPGVHANLKMVAVKIDASHVGLCTLIYIDGMTDDQMARANIVMNSLTLAAAP